MGWSMKTCHKCWHPFVLKSVNAETLRREENGDIGLVLQFPPLDEREAPRESSPTEFLARDSPRFGVSAVRIFASEPASTWREFQP
jgi:hypothetical protein